MLLEPAQIKHGIVRQPGPLLGEEIFQRDPVLIAELPTVQYNGRLIHGGQLQQPQTTKFGLEPSGLHVKRHEAGAVERVQVLDPLKNVHAG